ncbi:hypothetical protein TNCV_2436531 [Trichonephila clavipes]|nr:hypothetical protein TNCV_2436531 [Trichonephila clavipes]
MAISNTGESKETARHLLAIDIHHRGPAPGVMVWAAIGYTTRASLIPTDGMNKIRKTPAGLDCFIVLAEEFISVDNVLTEPLMADILEFVRSSKNIINVDSDSENEMNKAASVPTLFELRNVMKCILSYIEAHSNGKINSKMEANVEKFVDNLILKKTMQRKT